MFETEDNFPNPLRSLSLSHNNISADFPLDLYLPFGLGTLDISYNLISVAEAFLFRNSVSRFMIVLCMKEI
jgi:hypothetical protein